MKKFYVSLLCLVIAVTSYAQVKRFAVGPDDVSVYNLTAAFLGMGPNYYAGAYPDLKAVAADLNANNTMPTGYDYLYFELQSNYTETVTAPIVFTSTINVKIFPALGNAGVPTVSGPALGTNAMFVLDGAKHLIFDGRRNLSGSDKQSDIKWIIDNKEANGGPTFQLIHGATNNTLNFLQIQSSNTNPFSAAILLDGSGGGNNSNSISENIISRSAGNNYGNGILASGGANSYNIVSFNWISNFSSTGVKLDNTGYGDGWTIAKNHFFSNIVSQEFTAVSILGGNNNKITENRIGGTDHDMGGGPMTIIGAPIEGYLFTGIGVNAGAGALNTEVGDNIIGNISISSTTGNGGVFVGIYGYGGLNIYQNAIGSNGIVGNGDMVGILVAGSADGQLYKNEIKNLQCTSNNSVKFCAMLVAHTAGTFTVHQNIIDQSNFTTANQNTNPAFAAAAMCFVGTGVSDVYSNTLSFRNSSAVAKAPMTIFAVLDGDVTIRNNSVYSNASTGTSNGKVGVNAGYSYGLYQKGGIVKFINNAVGLGSSNEENIRGISLNTANSGSEYIYNTIYIGGSANDAATSSFCFERGVTIAGGAQTIANNIFYNDRSNPSNNGGSFNIENSTSWANQMNVHHNLHVAADDFGMSYDGVWKNFADYKSDLNEDYSYYLKTSDIPSIQFFINATPTSGDLRVNTSNSLSWYANGKGMPMPGYNKDIYNVAATRSISPAAGSTDLGAYEFTPDGGVLPINAELSGNHTLEGTEQIKVGGLTVAEITWGQTGTLPGITAKYYTGVKATPAPDPIGTPKTYNGYWDITATGGSNYSYDFKCYLDPALISNLQFPDLNNHIIKKSGTSNWQDRTTAYDNNEGSMQIFGETGFSLFTVADVTTVLPVALEYFNAAKQNNDVVLKWKSTNELDHKLYETERSFDGKNFSSFRSVTPLAQKEYTVTDESILSKYAGKIFYRLKMVSTTDKITYGAVAIIDNTNAKTQSIKLVSENPFTDHIDIQFNNEKPNRTNIMLYDATGKIIATRTALLPVGNSSIRLDNLQKLSPATYVLKVSTQTGGMSMQMSKK